MEKRKYLGLQDISVKGILLLLTIVIIINKMKHKNKAIKFNVPHVGC